MSDLLKLTSPDLTASQKTAIERYVRSVEDEIKGVLPVSPEWFRIIQGDFGGAKGADNYGYWLELQDYLASLAANVSGNFQGLWDVSFGLGAYEFTGVLDCTSGSFNLSGRGAGHIGSSVVCGPTRLLFYNSGGIRIQSTNTSGISTKDGALHTGADRTFIRDLGIEGNFSGTEAEYYGLHIRGSTDVTNVAIANFAGEAFRIEASTGAVGGNATDCVFINCHGWGSRNGMYFTGNNTGACAVLGGTFNNNREWGIKSSNSLANVYYGIETNGNGVTSYNDGSSIGASVVSDGVNRYFAISGQEVAASTNAPSGTTADNTWWAYYGAGGSVSGKPLWVSGMTVRAGGSALANDSSSPQLWSGCYAETNQGKNQLWQGNLVTAGHFANWCFQNTASGKGTAIIQAATNGVLNLSPAISVPSGSTTVDLGAQNGNTTNIVLKATHSTIAPSAYRWFFNGNEYYHSYNGSITATAMVITGPNTTEQFNTGSAVPQVAFMRRLAIPSSINGAITTARQICRAATSSATYAAPAGGVTVDTECRASLGQLAADVADIKTKLQAANLMT
jgi:hypothetical protein